MRQMRDGTKVGERSELFYLVGTGCHVEVKACRRNADADVDSVLFPTRNLESFTFIPWLLDLEFSPNSQKGVDSTPILGMFREKPNKGNYPSTFEKPPSPLREEAI